MNLLKRIAFVWIQYREFQAAFARLDQLSDRQLSERGLARSDLGWLAYQEAERRAATLAPGRTLWTGLEAKVGLLRRWAGRPFTATGRAGAGR